MRPDELLNLALRNCFRETRHDVFEQIEAAGGVRLASPRPSPRLAIVTCVVEVAVDAAVAVPVLRDRGRAAHLVDIVLLADRHPVRVVLGPGDDLVEPPQPLVRLAPPAGGSERVEYSE